MVRIYQVERVSSGTFSCINSNANHHRVEQKILKKNWAAIPKTLEMYRNPGSNVEAGLLRRRKAEGELWKENSGCLNPK